MKEYIKAMRLPACIFAGLLTLASFKLVGNVANGLLPMVVTMAIFVATMAQNDLRDRWNDTKKGKCFAFENPVKFKCFVSLLWVIAIFVTSMLFWQNPFYLIVAGSMILVGLVYSEIRQIPFLPNSLVAITTGSSVLYPICDGNFSCFIFIYSSIISITIFGREILKDFEDSAVDPNYKWTMIQVFGEKKVRLVAGLALVVIYNLIGIMTFFIIHFLLKKTSLDLMKKMVNGDADVETIGWMKKVMDGLLVAILIIMLITSFHLTSHQQNIYLLE